MERSEGLHGSWYAFDRFLHGTPGFARTSCFPENWTFCLLTQSILLKANERINIPNILLYFYCTKDKALEQVNNNCKQLQFGGLLWSETSILLHSADSHLSHLVEH